MSARNLELEIGGRRFAVSCAPGEEERLAALAAAIDTKAREAGVVGQSEPRMLLFAALLLADELDEVRKGQTPPEPEPDPINEARLVERIGMLTRRIENIARDLEGGGGQP